MYYNIFLFSWHLVHYLDNVLGYLKYKWHDYTLDLWVTFNENLTVQVLRLVVLRVCEIAQLNTQLKQNRTKPPKHTKKLGFHSCVFETDSMIPCS